MNILYIVRVIKGRQSNLESKFISQMEGMKGNNFNVYYIEFDEGTFKLYRYNDGKLIYKDSRKHKVFKSYYNTMFYIDLISFGIKVVQNKKIDIIYIRKYPFFRNIIHLLKIAKNKNIKIYIEIPTFPNVKERQNYSMIKRAYLKRVDLIEKKIGQYVDKYFVIGENCDGEYNSRPAVNINNGVSHTLKQKDIELKNDVIRLVAVGSISYWHGYDRLINGLLDYNGDRKFEIYIVGKGADLSLSNMKKMVSTNNLTNVKFIDSLYNIELDHLFDICDIAIDTLGFYRKDVFEGNTSLKSREYMKRGIPFIYSLGDNYPTILNFLMRVDNNDSNINFDDISAYYDMLKGKYKEYSDILVSYANETYSWTKIYSVLKKG